MKKMLEFIRRKYAWSIIIALLLSISTTYTMLDALVISRPYGIVSQEKSGSAGAGTQTVSKATSISGSGDSSNNNSGGSNSGDSSSSSDGDNSNSIDSSTLDSPTPSVQTEAAASDYSYKDDNIKITVEKLEENGAVFYAADMTVFSKVFPSVLFLCRTAK